jgi:hypothetical protein
VVIGKYFFRNMQEFEGQELVFLMKVLADEVNVGMTGLRPQQVPSASAVLASSQEFMFSDVGNHFQWRED